MSIANTEKKRELVNDIFSKMKEFPSLIIYNYVNITNNELVILRENLKPFSFLRVYKNSLMKKAFENKNFSFNISLKGINSFIFCKNNFHESLKKLNDFSNDIDEDEDNTNRFIFAIHEDKYIDSEKLKKLSLIPSKEEIVKDFFYLFNSYFNNLFILIEKFIKKENNL